jgi:predicted XRE-type DNA-binding protein
MTATFGAISEYMLEQKASRAEEREAFRLELERMSKAMVEEEGLLNHVQAATLLGVSVKRVSELVRLRKLTRFDFANRTYVSMKEVRNRYREEIAAGERIRESLGKRVLLAAKAGLLESDSLQWKHQYKEAREEEAVRKQRVKERQRALINEGKKQVVKFVQGVLKDSVRVPVKRKKAKNEGAERES